MPAELGQAKESRRVAWNWVLNYHSLFATFMGTDLVISRFVQDTTHADQLQIPISVAYVAAGLGLYFYSRKRGGMVAVDPPAEVVLFWWMLFLAGFAVLCFTMGT